MKHLAAFLLAFCWTTRAVAQIPYFAATVGDGKLYGYTSVKARPGINSQETYTTFQYGLGDHVAAGMDLYTGLNTAYWGALARYGTQVAPWLSVGGEVTASFDLNNNYHFAYLTSALYLNGALSHDGRLFWCTNTFWVVNDGAENTCSNLEYLGYTVPLGKGIALTPMVGAIHSWRFDQDADVAAGCYLSLGQWCVYLWGNDFLKSHPRVVAGIEFAL